MTGISRLFRRRAVVGLVAVVLILAVAMWLYASKSSAATQYRMASATLGTVTQTIPLSGNLTPVSAADLDFGASGKVAAVNVQVGQSVTAGAVLATLDTSSLAGALTQAQANLQSAQAKLSLDQQGATPQNLAQAEGSVSSGTVALQNAQTSLADTTAANAQAASQAQATVDSAQATVNADQNTLNADQNTLQADQAQENTDCAGSGSSSTQCQQDQQKVQADQGRVNTDQQTLNKDQSALAGAKQAQAATLVKNQQSLDQAQAQVNTATVSLQNAQAALKALQAGATSQQLAIDQAAVSVAQVNVDSAQRALNSATLTAPTNGVITAVNLVVGQSVSGGSGSTGSTGSATGTGTSTSATHQVSMLTPGAFQVTGSVGDAQVGQIADGQLARVVPAGSTEALGGKVTAVSPTATITSGVATFAVTVTLDSTDLTLRSGTSAAVNIIVNQVVGVITVPSSAVRNQGAGQAVQVLENGQAVMRPVQVGASDANRTQILSGLSVGDQIIVATISRNVPTTTNNGGLFTGGGGGRGGFGGGGGGGGRGGGG